MKAIAIVGLSILALLWLAGSNTPLARQLAKDGAEFCAKSPAQREMILINTWARERHKPGNTWSTFDDFRRTIRNAYGC
jgi:hypothetical protein